MNSYLFYDIETSGLNKVFDQVLQFAAIRTDMLFREMDRHIISLRLRPDVICSPEAMVVNRISITESMSGICEYEATRQIHRLMNEPGTVSLGYNTLGFDDEFLRFAFHRNLLPPYTHQYDKGCHRMDLLPMVTIFHLYREEILNWPEDRERTSLKLEYLNAANQLAGGPAHDAIVDVAATVELARRLSREEEMWNYLVGHFSKETDRLRLEKLPPAFAGKPGDYRLGLAVGSEYGPSLRYQVPVVYIGDSIPYSNQTLWLRLDLPELKDTSADEIRDTTWVVRKKLGEPDVILPPLERYMETLGAERRAIVDENLAWLDAQPQIFQEIIKHHREYAYPVIPDLDVDASLYQFGFLSRREQGLCRQFHECAPEDKAGFADRFPNPVPQALAERIVWRNYPEFATRSISKRMKHYMRRVSPAREEDALLDYKGDKRRTPADALEGIAAMRQEGNLDEHQLALIDELEGYLTRGFL